MIRTQINAIFFAQQCDSSISNKDYIVHSFKFILLDISISFFSYIEYKNHLSASILTSFNTTSSIGGCRLLHEYSQYTQLHRSIQSTLELNEQNRQKFEFSMRNTEDNFVYSFFLFY
jgi:hypothetical protein